MLEQSNISTYMNNIGTEPYQPLASLISKIKAVTPKKEEALKIDFIKAEINKETTCQHINQAQVI